MITIMSSLAQEESRSISENVTWGWRKRIADGKVSMTYGNFLGYERGADGTPVIDEAQAGIVRQIYGMFLDGQTPSSIAATLTKQGVPTPTGRTNWQNSTVKSILTNEKYKHNTSAFPQCRPPLFSPLPSDASRAASARLPAPFHALPPAFPGRESP